MLREEHKFLDDMLDRARFTREYMSDKSLEDLLNKRPIRSAVERELTVLGEALYQLNSKFPKTAQKIESWNKIIHFRHVLVHGYDSLNMHVIWDVIQDNLDPLITQLEAMLKEE